MTLRRLPARGKLLNLQTFDPGITGWSAGANASALTRDTTKDFGYPSIGAAALRWTATAAGDSTLSSNLLAVPSGVDVLATVKVWIGGTGTATARLALDYYDTGSNYLNGEYNYARTGLAVGRWATLICPLTMPANGSYAQPSVTLVAATAGQQVWIDNFQLTT